MILFITKYLADDFGAIQKEVYILAVPYIVVFLAMMLDLIVGVMKARRLGEARTSEGYRRTVTKTRDYFGLLLCTTLIDIIMSIVPAYSLPYATFGYGLYLVFVEWRSIREKGEDKTRRQSNKDLHALVAILENRGDLVQAFAEVVKNEIKEAENKEAGVNISQNSGNVNTGNIGGDNINI